MSGDSPGPFVGGAKVMPWPPLATVALLPSTGWGTWLWGQGGRLQEGSNSPGCDACGTVQDVGVRMG